LPRTGIRNRRTAAHYQEAERAVEFANAMRPILHFAPHVENFLVIDAAERLSHGCALKAKTLIELLRKRNVPGAKAGWHVLIVGQTEAWVGGTVRDLAGAATLRNFEVKRLPDTTVRQVLRTIAGLEWLATHGDAVSRHLRFVPRPKSISS
jgi:hypothetical protein